MLFKFYFVSIRDECWRSSQWGEPQHTGDEQQGNMAHLSFTDRGSAHCSAQHSFLLGAARLDPHQRHPQSGQSESYWHLSTEQKWFDLLIDYCVKIIVPFLTSASFTTCYRYAEHFTFCRVTTTNFNLFLGGFCRRKLLGFQNSLQIKSDKCGVHLYLVCVSQYFEESADFAFKVKRNVFCHLFCM